MGVGGCAPRDGRVVAECGVYSEVLVALVYWGCLLMGHNVYIPIIDIASPRSL
jgi:hypothetical protein